MTSLRFIWTSFRINLMHELAYRTNFYLQIIQTLITIGFALISLTIVFNHTDSLGGWQHGELMIVVGIYILIRGIIQLVIGPSLQGLMHSVQQGTLDFTLLKPLDAQIMVSVDRIQIWNVANIGLGIGVVIISLLTLNTPLRVWQVASFSIAFSGGIIIVYSFWLILATCAFWFVRVESIFEIFHSLIEAGRWPVSIYPQGLRFALTFLVPAAAAITIPAEALVGRLTSTTLIAVMLVAILMMFSARWFWHVGLRRYAGASA